MALVCPKCGTSFEQRYDCPRCGDRLIYHGVRGSSRFSFPAIRWQETAIGRIAIGLLLSQGMFHGFRQLATGILLAVNTEGGTAQATSNPVSFVSLQILQLVSVVIGGMLAGSSCPQGLLLGAVVGVCNGLICAILQFGSPEAMSPIVFYGHPLLHVSFGALGGWLGSVIWAPISTAAGDSRLLVVPKGKRGETRSPLFAGKIAWGRVTVGILLALVGCYYANVTRNAILDMTTGRLNTTDFQDYVLTWELKALAVLLGGAVAGMNTRNGLKQGLCVGLVVGILLIGFETRGAARFLELAVILFAGSLALALAGGWFGGQLFPPVVPRKRLLPVGG